MSLTAESSPFLRDLPPGGSGRIPDRRPLRERQCNTCLAGLCNALIRSVLLADSGCAHISLDLTRDSSIAPRAVTRSRLFRRRLARASACAPGLSPRALRSAPVLGRRSEPARISAFVVRISSGTAPICARLGNFFVPCDITVSETRMLAAGANSKCRPLLQVRRSLAVSSGGSLPDCRSSE